MRARTRSCDRGPASAWPEPRRVVEGERRRHHVRVPAAPRLTFHNGDLLSAADVEVQRRALPRRGTTATAAGLVVPTRYLTRLVRACLAKEGPRPHD